MTSRSLGRNESGAIMVAGLFFCFFLAALLFALQGVAHTLLAQEGMQDAADAGAFSAAVFHARGMNLIAYINMLMAALVAVLIALKLAQSMLTMSGVMLIAAAPFTYGITSAPGTVCKQLGQMFGQFYDNAKDPVMQALEGLHYVEEAVQYVTPALALVDGFSEVADNHPPAEAAFALPAAISLPVESDEFKTLCKRGGRHVAHLALLPFTAVSNGNEVVDGIIDRVAEGFGEATGALSNFLCGDESGDAGGIEPPSRTERIEEEYPELPDAEGCETETTTEYGDISSDGSGESCDQVQKDAEKAKPEADGSCPTSEDCTRDGPYESRAAEARRICEPRDGFEPHHFQYRLQTIEVRYVFENGIWVEQESTSQKSELVDAEDPPCGPNGTVGEEWNRTAYPRGTDELLPVCIGEETTQSEPQSTSKTRQAPREGDEKLVTTEQVTHLFGCKVWREHRQPLAESGDAFGPAGSSDSGEDEKGSEPSGGESSEQGDGDNSQQGQDGGGEDDSKSPMKLSKDAALGGDEFQLRAVAYGSQVGPGSARDGVKLSLWGPEDEARSASEEGDVLGAIREVAGDVSHVTGEVLQLLAHFSIAQSEYYFPAEESTERADLMWIPYWTARLKRFRLPSQEEDGADSGGEARGQSDADETSTSESAKSEQYGGMQETTAQSSCTSSGASDCESVDSILTSLSDLVLH